MINFLAPLFRGRSPLFSSKMLSRFGVLSAFLKKLVFLLNDSHEYQVIEVSEFQKPVEESQEEGKPKLQVIAVQVDRKLHQKLIKWFYCPPQGF